MAMNKETPLDEMVWAHPGWAGQVNPTNVLFYFFQSPFFDRTSNNATLSMQAHNQANLYYLLTSRPEFENRLRTMVGTEFVVAMEDPAQGVYIIKKQLRKSPDDAVPLEAYFIIGENIFMAPTVYSVLMNRMLSSLTLISKAHSLAASMSNFTPDSGYSYPDSAASNAPSSSAQHSQIPLSQQSVASTPVPSGSSATTSTTTTTAADNKSAQQRREEASLIHSLTLSLRYAAGQPGGFLDDNIITDPQAIIVSTASAASSQQHQQSSQGSSQGSTSIGTAGGSQSGGPPKLDIKTKDAKGKGGNTAGSPTSPTSPTGTMKKRRKSKAAGALQAAAAAAADANNG